VKQATRASETTNVLRLRTAYLNRGAC